MFISSTFYKYFKFGNCDDKRGSIKQLMLDHEVKGKIIISSEGINGAVCVAKPAYDLFMSKLGELIPEVKGINSRRTFSDKQCFKRTLVKIRNELVPLGVPGIVPNTAGGGKPLDPAELFEWYKQKKNFLIVDARNEYEWKEGSFLGAENPQIEKFRDFNQVAKNLEEKNMDKKKPIVTFCTGGIRCEKASAYLKKQGFYNVYKLEGGIIEFMRLQGSEDYWKGNLFVFDKREKINSCNLERD